MGEEKWKFLNNEILAASIFAGLVRGYPVYKKTVSEENKKQFKDFLKQKLRDYGKIYRKRIDDKEHFKNIEKFSKEVSDGARKKFGEIFVSNRFRIGRAQKCLNLYLKYLWVLGKISEPPHCPFDSIVIGELGLNTAFTKMDSISEYKSLVVKAKKKSGFSSISEWELKLWNRDL